MYLTVKQQLKHLTKEEYLILRELCHYAKNLYNQALYEYRQAFFEKRSKKVGWYSTIKKLQGTENYMMIQVQVAQHIIKAVDDNFKSFWSLYKNNQCARLPRYLDKDEFFTLRVPKIAMTNNTIKVPYSRYYGYEHKEIRIKIPNNLSSKYIRQVLIIPRQKARFFEIHYLYEVNIKEVRTDKNILAIDLGVTNLCTCVDTLGNSFIVDGKRLKSYNQWCNKEVARLSSVKDKQKIKGYSSKQYRITRKRNNRVNDIIHKTCKYIINYALDSNISTIVCGFNKGIQSKAKLGKSTQIFTQIPYLRLRQNLEYLCKLNGLTYIEQEESYTSKASFWDKDPIPELGDENIPKFSGRRIKRGLYKTADGTLINADVNGALNILRKSNVVSLEALYSRGELSTPMRIRVI